MSETTDLYERLRDGVALVSEDAGVRIVAEHEPAGGAGAKVFPPTYPDGGYLIEDRYDDDGKERRVVLLDSFQSQANRCEEALLDAVDAGQVVLPFLETSAQVNSTQFRVTSLGAPHRWPDAYFRFSQDEDGTVFDETDVGKALLSASPTNARAFYAYVPSDLVFGYWNSYRGTGDASMRLARSYTSELVGIDPQEGQRRAGRVDPYNLTDSGEDGSDVAGSKEDKARKKRLSQEGLGNIPASIVPAGVSIKSAERRAYLGFATLSRLRFPSDDQRDADADAAGRATLAALGLLADRLAFARPELFLRSGCSLLRRNERLAFVKAGGREEEFKLDRKNALALFEHAVGKASEAGLVFNSAPVRLTPGPDLASLVEKHFAHLPAGD